MAQGMTNIRMNSRFLPAISLLAAVVEAQNNNANPQLIQELFGSFLDLVGSGMQQQQRPRCIPYKLPSGTQQSHELMENLHLDQQFYII